MLCPKGSMRPHGNTDGSTCSLCSEGFYQDQEGGVDCFPVGCSNGTYLNASLVVPGLDRNPCERCPLGRRGTLSGSACVPCQAGQFQNELGKPVCKRCPKGRYQPDQAQSSCIACPLGRYTDVFESTQCNSWTYCNTGQGILPGFEGSATQQTVCRACSPSYVDNSLATFQDAAPRHLSYCIGYANDCAGGVLHKHGLPHAQRLCRFPTRDTCPEGFTSHAVDETVQGAVCKRTEYMCPA